MSKKFVRLQPKADRRLNRGHPWVYSNEINTKISPLTSFQPGEIVVVENHAGLALGMGFINPHSLITVRLLSRDPEISLDTDLLVKKLTAAKTIREKTFDLPYYRLVFSEADGLPGLVADRYGDYLVCQINTAGLDQQQHAIASALKIVLPDIKGVLLRNDSKSREQEGLERYVRTLYGDVPDEVLLIENGVQFYAPIHQGQKTGWFYDQRSNRNHLKQYVAGKKVLDVFSYLGAFAIQSLVGGATKADCIDASALSKNYILKNAQLNAVADKVQVFTNDAFDQLKALRGEVYDVIIVDPPAFIKKAKDKSQGQIAYQRINELALHLLAKDGVLMSCSCSMHLSMAELTELLTKAAMKTSTTLQIIEQGSQSPDHPVLLPMSEMNYLKAITLRKI